METVGSTLRAVFQPKRVDTLRDSIRQFVGKEALWDYAGHVDDDHSAYPGQSMWTTEDPGFMGLWAPREDLVPVYSAVPPQGKV